MTAPPHRPGRGRDSKSDLLDAARAAVEDRGKAAIATAAAAGAPRRRKRRRGALAALGVIGGILVLVQPDWLAGPKAPPAELPAVAAASLRVTMWRERDRVIAYQKQFGQLPATGADAGITTPGLEYQRAESHMDS